MNPNEADWEKEFDRVFVNENLWKSDDEFTANVPIENIKDFVRSVELSALERGRGEEQSRLVRNILFDIEDGLAKGHEARTILEGIRASLSVGEALAARRESKPL